MSSTTARRDEPNTLVFVALLAASVAVHAGLMLSMDGRAPMRAMRSPVEMAFFETKAPEVAKVELPKPEAPRIKLKAVAKAETTKREDTPPPIGGITPDSTAPNGDIVVPIGNTTLFKAELVVDPRNVKPYSAPRTAPPGSADSEPMLLNEVKIDYPVDAKNNDVDGVVRLRVTTDEHGVVTEVVVISGPGYGLNEAARDALTRFRFKPAMKSGAAVGYTFTYSYRFELN